MTHVRAIGCRRRRILVLALVTVGLTLLFGVAQGGAHHRCWHKSKTCDMPTRPDAVAPETEIVAGPSGTVHSDSVSFGFTSSAPGSTFECRLDVDAWSDCSVPAEYSGLWNQVHTFEVRARDASGIVDPTPAARSFEVQVAAPAPITVQPPAPSPDPASAPVKAVTRGVGSAPLGDGEAAGLVSRSAFEPRPGNATANARLASSTELAAFRGEYRSVLGGLQVDSVTGAFTGTTDEIIQWAAHKWGFDEDVLRSSAAVESWWEQSFIGDGGASPGLYQLRTDAYPATYRLAKESTAFNADLYGAMMRYYYDGKATWLNDPCCFGGTTYTAGDLWGTIGAHYSGRWYSQSSNTYIAKVKDYLAQRVWEQTGF